MKRYVTIFLLLLTSYTIFAQKDKMPTQSELEKMLKIAVPAYITAK